MKNTLKLIRFNQTEKIIGESNNLEQMQKHKAHMETIKQTKGIFQIVDEKGDIVLSDKGSDYVELIFNQAKRKK